MIGPGTGVRVYLACGATDMCKGTGGLRRVRTGPSALFAMEPLTDGP